MLKKIVPTILAVFFAASAFAAAPAFGLLDLDQNGTLSKAEADKAGITTELFAQADADKDGALSAEEYGTLVNGEKK